MHSPTGAAPHLDAQPQLPAALMPGEGGGRCFPHPSFSPRAMRAGGESGRRGCTGNIKQRLLRPGSSSGLGSQALSILRYLMTNNAGKRVFLQLQEPMMEWELAWGCRCAPRQPICSPWALPGKKQTPARSPNAPCQHRDATTPRASQAPICLQPRRGPTHSRQQCPGRQHCARLGAPAPGEAGGCEFGR